MNVIISIARVFLEKLLSNSGRRSELAELFDHAKDRVRKILILSLAAASCSALFVAGVILFFLGITGNYDQIGMADSRMFGGLILTILALAGFGISVSPSQWREQVVAQQVQPQSSALQEAIALAINEFLKEREIRRTQETAADVQPKRAA